MRSFSAGSSQGGNAEGEEKYFQKMSEGMMPLAVRVVPR
jgi:hypothetical protein